MLKSKTVNRVCCAVMALAVAASFLLWGTMEERQAEGQHEIGYETNLFDTGTVHTINITMDGWDSFIANATAEEYTDCNIEIDGEKYNHVAIRCKGNTSLSSVATLGSQRYSFKVEFDHFVEGMTYHGLDKISLNNLIQDATMMKDYLAYTLMNRMDVPSSLCSYVQINVNGEPWGLYLTVEGVEDAFMERNDMTKGELYKPDSLSFGGGRGNGGDFDIDVFRVEEETDGTAEASTETTVTAPAQDSSADGFGASSGMPGQGGDAQGFGGSSGMPAQGGDADGFGASSGAPSGDFTMPSGDFTMPEMNGEMPDMGDFNPGDMGGFGGFNFGMGNDDVKLIYSDDNPESYSNIFNNAKTKIKTKDKTRLIESIRKLNEKEDLDEVVDRDEVIRYMAVHNFLCNDDSYTGMMVHNYYLYEENGKLSIIPWDYNLGFGGFAASTDATSTVNSPIDSPVSSGTTDSRPLIAWIFSDEEALAEYHEAYSRFISKNIESGWLEAEITRVQGMITPYLEKDESKFYTMGEFTKAVDTLKTFCSKRGESIRGQLDGTIPSTSAGQRNSSALIDASEISTADMGSMNSTNGGGGFGGGGGFSMPDGGNFSMPGGTTGTDSGESGQTETAETENTETGTAGTQNTDTAPSAGTQSTDIAPSAGTQSTDTAPSAGTQSTDTAPSAGTQSTDTAPSAGTQAQPDQGGQAAEGTETAETPAADGTEAGTEKPAAAETTAAGETAAPPQSGDRGGPPSGGGGFSPPQGMSFGTTQQKDQSEQWIWLGVLSALLIAAILVIRRVRPHNK